MEMVDETISGDIAAKEADLTSGAAGQSLKSTIRDYADLTKPRITWLILMSTAIGYYFGHQGPFFYWASVAVFLHTIIGTGFVASGTAALNQWYERDADLKMRRTQMRPIPSGRVRPFPALCFGIGLAIVGALELGFGVNWLTSGLCVLTLLLYLFAYTPLKQKTWWSTTVGAVPGAMPPLIGYAASSGHLNAEAWALYAILFLWQFPHFYAIAWMYREDYARAGIRMLPVVEPDGESTARRMWLFSIALVGVSLLPAVTGLVGVRYFFGALVLSTALVQVCVWAASAKTNVRAKWLMHATVLHIPLLLGLMVFDKIPR